jgi:hypothetical protein
MKMLKTYHKLFFFILIVVGLACKKDKNNGGTPPPPPPPPTPTTITYTSDRQANLNVVYFIPSDMTGYPEYEKRISDILLDGQDFYKREMQRNGFGAKTFGLLKNDTYRRVKIITIKGLLTKTNYTYSDATKAISEINQHFATNPADKTSEHTLIIIPSSLNADGTPVGSGQNPALAVPFYGYGKWCFIKDFPTYTLTNISTSLNFVGGAHHELGHALGLPHNAAKQSEKAPLGTSLMGAGNISYGITNTFMTKADCAILNNNQIFNGTAITYYTTAQSTINRVYADYNAASGKIVVSGKLTATGSPVTDVLFYNDANFKAPNGSYNGFGVNNDYESVAWATNIIGNDSFFVEMPIAEFQYKDSVLTQLKVRMVHQNGVVSSTEYYYAFVNSIPVINFGYKAPISRSGWTVTASSEDPNNTFGVTGFANSMLDGDINSIWMPLRTNNGGVAGGVYNFTVDMGASKTLKGIITTSRQNNNGQILKLVDVEISNNGTTWQNVVTDYEAPQSTAPVNISFGATVNCRYFRVTSKTVWGGSTQNPAVAEINAYDN